MHLSISEGDFVPVLQDSSEESPKSPLFHVRFTFDRTPLRRMHAAIEEAFNPFFETLPVSQLHLPLAVDALYALSIAC